MIAGGLTVARDNDERTIPLYQEQIEVQKAETVTDRLRVTTHVDERAVLVEEDVSRGSLTVERVPVERTVAQAPEPRQEGDTLIVSVVEERLFVEKRLVVVEELRITRTTTLQHIAIPETVRTTRATVERATPSSTTGN